MNWQEWYDGLLSTSWSPEAGEPDQRLDPVREGLGLLRHRRRQLGFPEGNPLDDERRIADQFRLANEPWFQTRDLLRDFPDLVAILDPLWERVVPLLIKGNEVSPVHHIPFVVLFMTQIGLVELAPSDMKRGILASLLHDIGIGDSILPKIGEITLQKARPEERERLRQDGIRSRLEHMRHGAVISVNLLRNHQRQHPDSLSDEDLAAIVDIVATHDNSKIPLMEDVAEIKWLLSPNRSDWLKQCHWEADALWMLSPAGILVDLLRQNEADTPANRKSKFQFNLGLHAKIVSLYRDACSDEEMASFGFREGLLYRSQAGYGLCEHFMKLAAEL